MGGNQGRWQNNQQMGGMPGQHHHGGHMGMGMQGAGGGHHHHGGGQSGYGNRRNHQGGYNRGRGRGGFGNSPYKPHNAVVPKTPINLITNNFKIQSQNNHSGIIYTYSVDFIDGEHLETMEQMPLPTQPKTELPAIEAEIPATATSAAAASMKAEESAKPAAAA